MTSNSDLGKEILQSISGLFKDENLADFSVVVNDTIYKCHRFILGACSRFFYALFTTNMKEKMDSTARLYDMDSSIFEVILKICYTGENLVNEENVLSVWQAANRLEIPFLLELCEQFTGNIVSIKNYADIYTVAKDLDSQSVLKCVTNFILKNFMTVKDDYFFLQLSAQELIELLENNALEAKSEDDVLISILKWVDDASYKISYSENAIGANNCITGPITLSEKNWIGSEASSEIHSELENKATSAQSDILETHEQPQDRSVHLQSLLKASRLCLASPQCLQMLYKHRLTQSEEGAKNVIFEAMLYQMKGYGHGYFPPQALYRNSSEFEHVGIFAYSTGGLNALSLAREKWFRLDTCEKINNKIKLALFDNNVYAVGDSYDSSSKVCVLKDSTYSTIAKLSGIGYFLLSHKSYLYLFNTDNGKVFRMNPNSFDKTPKPLEHKAGFVDLEFALSYKEFIIVFSKDKDADKEETSVYVMNTLDETWHRHENLNGSAQNMASFQDCDRTYLLQSNGNLWSLSTDNVLLINFKFIRKIWESNEHLGGALLYKGKLYFFVKSPSENAHEKVLSTLPGVYKCFHRWALDGYVSNFICAVMYNLDLVNK